MRRCANALPIAVVIAGCGAGGAFDGAAGDGGDGDRDDGASPLVEAYIRGDVAAALVLEIDAVPGFEPDARAVADVASLLGGVLDKPAGIDAVEDGALASRGADHPWTDAELRELAGATFDLETGADAAVIHVLYVDGRSARDSDSGVILGLAFGNHTVVMFKNTIERVCSGSSVPVLLRDDVCREAERAIFVHEIGHVIGLVDNGLEMVTDHRDPEHGAHDADDNCVMYFAYQGSALVDRFRDQLAGGGEPDLGFGDACLADIAAVRDR